MLSIHNENYCDKNNGHRNQNHFVVPQAIIKVINGETKI